MVVAVKTFCIPHFCLQSRSAIHLPTGTNTFLMYLANYETYDKMWALVDEALQIRWGLGFFGLAHFAAQCCKPTIGLNKEGNFSKHRADIQ